MERLRAAFTPQTTAALLVFALLAAFMLGTSGGDETARLEARAEEVLSGMQGAGRVRVVISVRTPSLQKGSTGLQSEKMRQIPAGAVAVAQGAEDPFVCAQLTQALCALLGLPASCVSVLSGG